MSLGISTPPQSTHPSVKEPGTTDTLPLLSALVKKYGLNLVPRIDQEVRTSFAVEVLYDVIC